MLTGVSELVCKVFSVPVACFKQLWVKSARLEKCVQLLILEAACGPNSFVTERPWCKLRHRSDHVKHFRVVANLERKRVVNFVEDSCRVKIFNSRWIVTDVRYGFLEQIPAVKHQVQTEFPRMISGVPFLEQVQGRIKKVCIAQPSIRPLAGFRCGIENAASKSSRGTA